MNCLAWFVLLTLAQTPTAGPAIQVSTLAGDQQQGVLESFTAETVTLTADGKSVAVPISEVLLIRSSLQATAPSTTSAIEMRLIDGTRLRVSAVSWTGATATVSHPNLGELRIPISSISSVRFAPVDAKVDSEWNQLLERALKKDLVAIRKGDVLDHLDGVIGALNETKLQFQLDGDDLSIAREKVFGLIYSKRQSTAKRAIAQLELVSGDRLAVKQVTWNGKVWSVQLVAGLDLEVAHESLQTLDYSQGKITYLSDLEPRGVKQVPYFAPPGSFMVNEYRRDKNFDGSRIRLGEKSYSKGLAIHSQTSIKYRLGGDFRRLQAIMGIGDEVPAGDVDVIFKGDNRILFQSSAKATEPGEKGTIRRAAPQTLNIDVTGVVELEVFVDFGSDKRDIGDRLYLANARVMK